MAAAEATIAVLIFAGGRQRIRIRGDPMRIRREKSGASFDVCGPPD